MAAKDRKVAVKIGWIHFVMNMEAGMEFFKSLTLLEKMETSYNATTKMTEVKICPLEPGAVTMEFISDETYSMGKLLYAADQTKANQGE